MKVHDFMNKQRESRRVVVANVLNFDLIISKFKLCSRNYVHFQSNTHKNNELLIPPVVT